MPQLSAASAARGDGASADAPARPRLLTDGQQGCTWGHANLDLTPSAPAARRERRRSASPGPDGRSATAIASFDWSIDHGLLALAVALFAVAPLLQGLTFALGLRRVGAGGSAGALARMWARSFLLRYEPSGVVGFAYRVTARERVGASTAQVVTVTGYEQLAVVVAGAAAAMAGFLGAGVHPPVLAIVLFVGRARRASWRRVRPSSAAGSTTACRRAGSRRPGRCAGARWR